MVAETICVSTVVQNQQTTVPNHESIYSQCLDLQVGRVLTEKKKMQIKEHSEF